MPCAGGFQNMDWKGGVRFNPVLYHYIIISGDKFSFSFNQNKVLKTDLLYVSFFVAGVRFELTLAITVFGLWARHLTIRLPHDISCGRGIRTPDLQVMSLTSWPTALSHDISCLARIRTRNKRTKISCVTITPRGKIVRDGFTPSSHGNIHGIKYQCFLTL